MGVPMRTERLVAKVSRADKSLLRQAAAIEGTSVSRFAVGAAVEYALRLLGETATDDDNDDEEATPASSQPGW